jgi:hypothetical protein
VVPASAYESRDANQRRHDDERCENCFVLVRLPVQRLMLTKLFDSTHRQQVGSRPAGGKHMERRRALADHLTITASKFSRTCWITFQHFGITSSVSVMSSPNLDSRAPP